MGKFPYELNDKVSSLTYFTLLRGIKSLDGLPAVLSLDLSEVMRPEEQIINKRNKLGPTGLRLQSTVYSLPCQFIITALKESKVSKE